MLSVEASSPVMRERAAAVSFDSAALAAEHKKSKSSKRRKSTSSSAEKRSYSTDLMRHLTQEDVDVFNTPLSSLRSCSEFNRMNSFRHLQQQFRNQNAADARDLDPPLATSTVVGTGQKGFWSAFSKLIVRTTPSPASSSAQNTNFSQRRTNMAAVEDEERAFLVERLRFNEANLTDGERDERRTIQTQQRHSSIRASTSSFFLSRRKTNNCSPDMESHSLSTSSPSAAVTKPVDPRTVSTAASTAPVKTAAPPVARSFFLHESSVAVDYIFGYPLHPRNKAPMEIELKDLKKVVPVTADTIVSAIEGDALNNRESLTTLSYHSVETLRSVGTNVSLSADDNHSVARLSLYSTDEFHSDLLVSTHHDADAANSSDNQLMMDMAMDADPLSPTVQATVTSWSTVVVGGWEEMMLRLRQRFPRTRGDDLFYETIRLQPFSAGAYLRGMLLAGLSSTCFHWYNVLTWPTLATAALTSPVQRFTAMFLFVFLITQMILSTLQFPCRLCIHFKCWESSQEVQIDAAVRVLRSMLHSNSWMLNRLLGRVLDALAVFMLIFTELYLYLSPHCEGQEILRGIVISLGATNLLTIVCRVVVATCFSLSMHDPHILSEARRQGLSQYDLDLLPTLTLTKETPEVSSESQPVAETTCGSDSCCAICLCDFEVGQVLTCLPCDKKHSFHSTCIRQWLQRSNSCPLCQRMI